MPETADRQDRAVPPQLSSDHVLVVMTGLLLGMLLAGLDQTIVATALPTIAGDLHSLSKLSWIVTAYLLASTVSTPLWGKLGDLYGRKIFFQAAIVIFLIGSVLAGLSKTITELIIFRAIQGIGGGGLMVGAQTIVGDIVPPRDRGRYQGFFGAVFGVSSVLGPLIGGFFVDTLSWRWVFYVNLPVGVIALIVVAAVLPARRGKEQHQVDYLGTIMIGGAATSLVLLTSLGGVTYPWGSGPIITLAVLAVVFTAGFVVAERRAAEPVLPLHLFKQPVFTAASAIGFVVGFAMFGALTYLPQYLQIVQGVSPTVSGLRLLPLMAGLLATSIGTGQLISRWGRYKIFPVVGTAALAVGLFLLSHLGPSTSTVLASVYMFVFGAGIGATMQVLVIAVQNAIDYADLGAGTSGVTFFRSIGGSFGTAVFGAIFDRAARQYRLGSARAGTAGRHRSHERREPGGSGQAAAAHSRGYRFRVRGIDQDRLPRRYSGRRCRLRADLDAAGTAAAEHVARCGSGRPARADRHADDQDIGRGDAARCQLAARQGTAPRGLQPAGRSVGNRGVRAGRLAADQARRTPGRVTRRAGGPAVHQRRGTRRPDD